MACCMCSSVFWALKYLWSVVFELRGGEVDDGRIILVPAIGLAMGDDDIPGIPINLVHTQRPGSVAGTGHECTAETRHVLVKPEREAKFGWINTQKKKWKKIQGEVEKNPKQSGEKIRSEVEKNPKRNVKNPKQSGEKIRSEMEKIQSEVEKNPKRSGKNPKRSGKKWRMASWFCFFLLNRN